MNSPPVERAPSGLIPVVFAILDERGFTAVQFAFKNGFLGIAETL